MMCKNNNICILPIAIASILGLVVGTAFFLGIIATGIIAIPIAIATVFAAVSLVLLYVTAAFEQKKETKECICEFGKCLITGGAIALVVGFLALTFSEAIIAGSILSAILIGIGIFGFILNILSFFGLLCCLVMNNCYKKDIYCKYDND